MCSRILALVLAVAVVAAGCGGGDRGDPEAYCQLIRSGAGIEATNEATQASEFRVLLDVAPPDIRDAVQQLANTLFGLAEIDELDQLFEAAFDPEAQAARTAFNEYAVVVCGYQGPGLRDGSVGSANDLLRDLESFVDRTFVTASWPSKVRYDPVLDEDSGELTDVDVTFIIPPSGDEALAACAGVQAWAYGSHQASGSVRVLHDELELARTESGDATCVEV